MNLKQDHENSNKHHRHFIIVDKYKNMLNLR